MKITADTNVLLRLVMGDNEAQGPAAIKAVKAASLVAISAGRFGKRSGEPAGR